MGKNTKRTAVIAGIATVVIGGGAAAWAAGWGVTGTGTGEAKAATISPLSATAKITGNIWPGRSTTVRTMVTNPNEFPVRLTGSITPDPSAFTVTGGTDAQNAACKSALASAGGSVITATTFPGTPTISAGAGGQLVESSITIGDLPESCAGKTLSVGYSFTGTSA